MNVNLGIWEFEFQNLDTYSDRRIINPADIVRNFGIASSDVEYDIIINTYTD